MAQTKTAIALIVFGWAAYLGAQNGTAPYLDPIEARITDLISRMTLEEKAAELNHLSSRNDRLQTCSDIHRRQL